MLPSHKQRIAAAATARSSVPRMASIEAVGTPALFTALIHPSTQLTTAQGVQSTVYLVLTALLVLVLHRLVLRPYRMYHTLFSASALSSLLPSAGSCTRCCCSASSPTAAAASASTVSCSHSHTFLFLFMHHPTIITMHPAVIAQVTKSHYAAYEKGPISRATMAPIVRPEQRRRGRGGRSPARSGSASCRHSRITTFTPMTQLMMDITAQHIAGLQQRLASSSSSSTSPQLLLDLKPEFTALTFAIITSCAFGTSLSVLTSGSSHPAPHLPHAAGRHRRAQPHLHPAHPRAVLAASAAPSGQAARQARSGRAGVCHHRAAAAAVCPARSAPVTTCCLCC